MIHLVPDIPLNTLYGAFVTISRGSIKEWIPKTKQYLVNETKNPIDHYFILRRAWGFSAENKKIRCLDVGILWKI